MSAFTNRLISETSPYLLQHARNPVDWYPWSEEALQKAKAENKPILVSIGYSACHWCHVMERESFEDEETAALMNLNFINIKIDREERPDLDHIYMDAVQSMTGSGGWPLNVFLTPELKPFYGGTYFPPVRAYNRASWKEVLINVASAFTQRRDEVEEQAKGLTQHLQQANSFGMHKPDADAPTILNRHKTDEAFAAVMQQADKEEGGFGRAPKFPQTFTISFLLRYHSVTGNAEALQQACLSLDKMIAGGIYDQLGGGFSRYSTDNEWLAPHFEKMLYDNALLLSVLAEAYQLTKKERYREVIAETVSFLQREMLHESGGFYAALDADSEGVEGKFYTWNDAEVREVLGAEADLFCAYYDISTGGNWEHTNILRVKKPLAIFAQESGVEPGVAGKKLNLATAKLLERRHNRIRPGTDDKILSGWNALLVTALCKCYAATGVQQYLDQALQTASFLDKQMGAGEGALFHTWKNGKARYPGFLDDYAFLIQAWLQLQEVTGNTCWLQKAQLLAEKAGNLFADPEGPYYFYTAAGQTDIIVRKKEMYDGAQPSGNAVMAYNLYQLGILLDKPSLKNKAATMLETLGAAASRYPTSFGVWAALLLEMVAGTNELAIVGKGAEETARQVLAAYIPHKVFMWSEVTAAGYPLLENKTGTDGGCLIYLCLNYSCRKPVSSPPELFNLLATK